MKSDGLQKLKDIGAQKIYEDTHIPVEHIQAILHESFDGLTKIHFIGFISILQREYNIDLGELKSIGVAYYDDKTPLQTTMEDGIFLSSKKSRNFTPFYIVIVMILLFIALFYAVEPTNKTIQNTKKSDTHLTLYDVNTTQREANTTQQDVNKTLKESNATQVKLQESPRVIHVKKEEKVLPKSLKIVAKSKVWMGYMDLKTDKKYQKTFQGAFDLDPSKEWILVFGHGHVRIVIDSQEKIFNTKKTLRLLYKEGQIRELSFGEYKKLTKGKAW